MSTPASIGPKELHENSPVQMAEVIAGLLAGRNVSDIAETTGVPRGRITRWYRENERFKEMLEETSEDLIAQIRAEMVKETADALSELLPDSVATLKRVLDPSFDAKTSERIAAAAHVLRFSGLGGRKEAPKAGPSPEELIRGTHGPATGD